MGTGFPFNACFWMLSGTFLLVRDKWVPADRRLGSWSRQLFRVMIVLGAALLAAWYVEPRGWIIHGQIVFGKAYAPGMIDGAVLASIVWTVVWYYWRKRITRGS